jgi:Fe2+ or Zn2+ uptake regulation protein
MPANEAMPAQLATLVEAVLDLLARTSEEGATAPILLAELAEHGVSIEPALLYHVLGIARALGFIAAVGGEAEDIRAQRFVSL